MINFLFEINKDFIITEKNDDYIIIDNFYSHYLELSNYVKNLDKVLRSPENDIYRNCRTYLENTPSSYKDIIKIIEDFCILHFKVDNKVIDKNVVFNSTMLYKSIPINLQHWPHIDAGITGIIYLSENKDNGTVIYKNTDIKFPFGKGYFVDVKDLEIEHFIEAKPNRFVILNAKKLHGAYYKNYEEILNKERISQIIFTN